MVKKAGKSRIWRLTARLQDSLQPFSFNRHNNLFRRKDRAYIYYLLSSSGWRVSRRSLIVVQFPYFMFNRSTTPHLTSTALNLRAIPSRDSSTRKGRSDVRKAQVCNPLSCKTYNAFNRSSIVEEKSSKHCLIIFRKIVMVRPTVQSFTRFNKSIYLRLKKTSSIWKREEYALPTTQAAFQSVHIFLRWVGMDR